MAVNKRLLQGAAAAPGGLTPSEHFGVVLYEGNGESGHSINGGKFGAAFYGNGSNSIINLGNGKFAFDELSISVWVKPSGSGHRTILENYEYSGGSAGFIFRIDQTTGKARFVIYNGDCTNPYPDDTSCTNVTAAVSTSAIATNAWTHIAVTMKIGELKMYINGSLDVSTVTQAIGYHSSAPTNIGAANHAYASGGESFYEGKIDQLRVFSKVLSSSEVSTLYAETVDTVESLDPLSEDTTDTLQVLGDTSCVATYRFENNEDDLSGNYNGTGTDIQYAAGRYGQAASFDGSNSYVSGNVAHGDDYSVSAWVYPKSHGYQVFYQARQDSANLTQVGQDTSGGNGTISVANKANNTWTVFYTTSEPLATLNQWYHIVVNFTSSDAKIYVNGSFVESHNAYTSTPNYSTFNIGATNTTSYSGQWDGKIDQLRLFNKALSASEVTTLYEENSLVASYRFEGNANDDMRAYNGAASNVTYEYGLGFTPDFVWIKSRTNTLFNNLVNSTIGANYVQYSNSTSAGETNSNIVTSLDSGGFTVGNDNSANQDGQDFVAWCWKANGGTTSSNTDGDITSTVQANTDAGFSIVTWTSTSDSSDTIGHGLNSKPDVVLYKKYSSTGSWFWYTDLIDGSWDELVLNSSGAKSDFSGTYATSTTFKSVTSSSGADWVTYCFHSVDNFSKFGTYIGNADANGPIVETGFEPAFIMFKRTDGTSGWNIQDNRRNTTNPRTGVMQAHNSDQEYTSSSYAIDFLSNGFQIVNSDNGWNTNGGTYLYMAFAADPDTEAPAVAKSFSTVTWAGNATARDISLGFKPGFVWIKGLASNYGHRLYDTVRGAGYEIYSNDNGAEGYNSNRLTAFNDDGFSLGTETYVNGSGVDFVGWSWKADDNEPTIIGGAATLVYKFEDNANDVTGDYNGSANNISYVTGYFNKAAEFNGSSSYIDTNFTLPAISSYSISFWFNTTSTVTWNDFLADNPSNGSGLGARIILAIKNGTHFHVAISNGSSFWQDNSTVSASNYVDGEWHHYAVAVNGTSVKLFVDGSLLHTYTSSVSAGTGGARSITLGRLGDYNGEYFTGKLDQFRFYRGALEQDNVSNLYNETIGDNDDLDYGSPSTSIISANANAGFSIVKYEGNDDENRVVSHGLSSTPEMIMVKNLDDTRDWVNWHTSLDTGKNVALNSNTSQYTVSSGTSYGGLGTPTASGITFIQGTSNLNNVNDTGANYIAYCFHSVSGYSKFGSYTGTGGDMTITTGFQPDFVMIKRTDSTGSWVIVDSVRDAGDRRLYADLSNAEDDGQGESFVSTGFKPRTSTTNDTNTSGGTYIYAAFKIN